MSPPDNQLKAAGYSIVSNISVQLYSRIFTFVLGSITIKYLRSSALLGIVNVRLALLYSTLQFLSREPFRRACLGEVAKSTNKTWQTIVNTIWLGFVLSILFAIPLTYIWKLNAPSSGDLDGTTLDDYHNAVVVICLSVIIEMLAEPCFIYAQANAIIDHNPKVEILCVTVKCVLITFVTMFWYNSEQSSNILTRMTQCQLFASLLSVIYSYLRFSTHQKLSPVKFLPSTSVDNNASYFHLPSLKLSVDFVSQSFLKQLLTESERYVMTFFDIVSLSDQGIYDVVSNLGSLAARLIFKPVEESAYALFSQTVNRDTILNNRSFLKVRENLFFMVKSMLIIGLTTLTLGYNFVPLIVLYGGEKLNNELAFYLMRWQLFYTPILAVNGVTECFTFATMSSTELRDYNYNLVKFSLVFLGTVFLTRSSLSSACFILANCLVMLLRIFTSFKLIGSYFKKHGHQLNLSQVLPSLTTVVSLVGVFAFLFKASQHLLIMSRPFLVLTDMMLGGWCLIFIVHVIQCHEEDLVEFVTHLFRSKVKSQVQANKSI